MRAIKKDDRQAVVEFLVGTQGLYIPICGASPQWAPFTT